ncbi:hypothetical protein MKW92_021229 [Papaver armeniacum]|nr:hypothetical protein MKW92_021229 [Papaver armeniacum]
MNFTLLLHHPIDPIILLSNLLHQLRDRIILLSNLLHHPTDQIILLTYPIHQLTDLKTLILLRLISTNPTHMNPSNQGNRLTLLMILPPRLSLILIFKLTLAFLTTAFHRSRHTNHLTIKVLIAPPSLTNHHLPLYLTSHHLPVYLTSQHLPLCRNTPQQQNTLLAEETQSLLCRLFQYDSNYLPAPEKIAEAHKAARFAVGALAFDDVAIAVDFLIKSLELLTNPSAGSQ